MPHCRPGNSVPRAAPCSPCPSGPRRPGEHAVLIELYQTIELRPTVLPWHTTHQLRWNCAWLRAWLSRLHADKQFMIQAILTCLDETPSPALLRATIQLAGAARPVPGHVRGRSRCPGPGGAAGSPGHRQSGPAATHSAGSMRRAVCRPGAMGVDRLTPSVRRAQLRPPDVCIIHGGIKGRPDIACRAQLRPKMLNS